MKTKQKGFAPLESLLILLIIAIVVFIGWFVWHAKSQANKTLNDTLNSGQSTVSHNPKKTTASSAPSKKSTSKSNLITYTTPAAQAGVEITNASDVDKLDGASDSFKDFIKDKIKKNGNSPSPCGNAYGLTVKDILNDSFAVGNEGKCTDAEKLWAKVAGQWQEIGASQQGFDCSLLEQYKVPSAIVEKCDKNGALVDNTQS